MTQDIPITTYCQKGSYSAGSAEKKALVANTKPRNWRNLLEIPGLETLRVNLAHMGGDDAIETLFKGGKVTPRGWTYTIIQMLKKYPNVYADLSASDYHAQGGASRIRRNLRAGQEGTVRRRSFPGGQGALGISGASFNPNGKSHYHHYVERLRKALSASNSLNATTLMKKLTETNPRKFLRIT